MDRYTDQTKLVLEERFDETVEGIYYSHQPIYGYRSKYSAESNISRHIITKSILNALSQYSFSSFIDIGGAEGYTAHLVRKLFNAKVKITDLSESACRRAKEIFQIDAVPCDIHAMPFPDESFDLVLCSETIEHVTDFKLAIKQLLRITKNVLVITVPHESVEEVEYNIKNNVPHGHINYFDVDTLDYLKQEGYVVKFEKTLSPLLVVPRVIAEGSKKNGKGMPYRLYNSVTPLLKKLFGIKTAIRLIDVDARMCSIFKKYSGITFIIEKKDLPHGVKRKRPISAKDFIYETVPPYKLG
ncbi:MAG: class I SAM-dependent methyltransferase [Chitinophagaceae bacterium]|nr:class I SAM-dependent methyltransferase [Chitinophagaceae bacterium]